MEARIMGWIVSRHEAEPFTVPFRRGHQDWSLPDCKGEQEICWAETLSEAIDHFFVVEFDAEVTRLHVETEQ
jgi:hypothetical protein